MRVEYDGLGLRVDGERRIIRSASLDYVRLPSVSAWRDRLEKIASAGFNCVSVSYPWSYHAESPGNYDFSGVRDVDLLHDMLEEAGLYLIARPGPWVGSDLDAGGLPAWLLCDDRAKPRCRTGGQSNYSLEFMHRVEEWFDRIVPRFAGRSNLLLVEVEHQYSAPAPLPFVRGDLAALVSGVIGARAFFRAVAAWQGDPFLRPPLGNADSTGQQNSYMRELCRLLRERGVGVPLTHADLWPGLRQRDPDLPALERREIVSSDGRRAFERELHAMRGDRRSTPEDVPLLYLGIDAGASDGWGGIGFSERRAHARGRPIEGLVLAALAEGASLINVRRLCGGVSWGYMGSPAVYSSHDCAAPVSEGGQSNDAYEALRRLNHWLDRFEEELSTSRLVEQRAEEHLLIWQRRGERHRFCFVQSTSPRRERLAYEGEPRIELEPFETQIRVYDREDRLAAVTEILRPERSEPPPAMRTPPMLPQFGIWKFSGTSPQLSPAFDDSSWSEISTEQIESQRAHMDALGVHHGFIWYRGTFSGELDRLVIEARHSYSVWLNGGLIAQGDPPLLHPLGLEPRARVSVRVPQDACKSGRNALVLLVENLGHSEGVLGDISNPRGLLHLDTGSTRVAWRYRGGLVRGERGLAPVVAFEAVERVGATDVSLPHSWAGEPDGVGLYETSFRLEGLDPKLGPLALRFDPGRGKANLYVNGYLIGRHWPERGPQQEFSLPWGVLEADQENHIAVAVWKRSDRAALGHLRLVLAS